MKNSITVLICAILISSCKTDLDYSISGYKEKIIVEGYISNNEFPKVYLTLNIPLSKSVDSTTILENVIRTAKVTVSDSINPNAKGAKTEILTSGWESDKRLFPPYKYFGTDIIGEAGKTYYLTVEIGGYILKSQTTIPQSPDILEFRTTAVGGNDKLRELYVSIDINPKIKNSYRIYSKKKKDGYFIETQLLYNSDFNLNGKNTFLVSPKVTGLDRSFSEGGYFNKGDTVQIRLCAIDSVSTQFFKALTMFSSLNGIGNTLFVGEKDKLKSNISSPGFGIWYGNGVRNYDYVIQ